MKPKYAIGTKPIDIKSLSESSGRSIYFTPDNLKKIDNIRGLVKRSTIINLIIQKSDEKWIKKLLE